MIKYKLNDFLWLIGFVLGDLILYKNNVSGEVYFVYNFMCLLTMFVVGVLSYKIHRGILE